MFRSDFDYDLPKHLIAQRPSEKRANSRLLQVRRDAFEHRRFSDLLKILQSDDLLIVNDTVVIKARLRGLGYRGSGRTAGGKNRSGFKEQKFGALSGPCEQTT